MRMKWESWGKYSPGREKIATNEKSPTLQVCLEYSENKKASVADVKKMQIAQNKSSQTFCSQDPSTLLKITEDPQNCFLRGLYLMIFAILRNKTEKLLKY